jgi:hypothetical protein
MDPSFTIHRADRQANKHEPKTKKKAGEAGASLRVIRCGKMA